MASFFRPFWALSHDVISNDRISSNWPQDPEMIPTDAVRNIDELFKLFATDMAFFRIANISGDHESILG